ncbi:MAG TPA: ABC transporter permease [Longimicrobiales bacterium]|nr:ABC transporter permease [Longimicrobiales bacterium]
MRELLLVSERELRERVRTRSFLIGTLMLPVLVLLVLAVTSVTEETGMRRLVVVDEAPPPLGEAFVVALNRAGQRGFQPVPRRGGSAARYRVEVVRGPIDSIGPELRRRLETARIDGYVVLPGDLRETGRVHFRSRDNDGTAMLRDVRTAATDAVQADRLVRSGLQLDNIGNLLEPATVEAGPSEGRSPRGVQTSFYGAFFVATIIYLMIALYGTGVTRSVLEEKNNRIAEVLISSMRATHLMAGKILGVGAAVLLQVSIWIATFALVVTQSGWVSSRLGINADALAVIVTQPGTTALLVAYLVLGFLLFAALFAGLGAAVTSDQEAQAYQMLIMLPLFLPLFFLFQLTTDPLGRLARMLGLVPLTSPVAMPMRMAAGPIPVPDLLLSLGALLLATAAVAWVSGKIYRIGLLATGRKPTLRELLHWLRTG